MEKYFQKKNPHLATLLLETGVERVIWKGDIATFGSYPNKNFFFSQPKFGLDHKNFVKPTENVC